ncbi:MAG: ribonuclease III [Proteobacteria bacterium]|nr:ribonuclease III [Pseudomonadota bacterium]
MSESLRSLMDRIGYAFQDERLLENALRHRSVGDLNNERLEFLGDAVLSLIITEALFEDHPKANEGELSRMRAILVSGVHLAELARKLELGPYLSLGYGEQKTGGQQRDSILTDAFEALIGAIYLDGGILACRQCIFKWYGVRLEDLSQMQPAKDAKSYLQEWVQAHKFPLPTYKATVSGKQHEQVFVVVCEVEGLPYSAQGSSTSRRKAEQLAAKNYLDLLT